MFRTTLVNLSPDGTHASPELGTRVLGDRSAGEVRTLLEQFRTLDAAANAKADPEILFETRRQKHLVRTGQNRLYLYDPRDALAPAHVLSVDELMAELDGTASAARSRSPFVATAAPVPTDEVPVAPAQKPRTMLRAGHRISLAAASLGLAGYLGFATLSAQSVPPSPAFEPVADAQEGEHYRNDLAGVYMTGQLPGDHGIAFTAEGTMKLFQLNAHGTPSLIQDSFRVGRIDGQLSALGAQSDLPVRIIGRNMLSFGGENYLRVP